LPRVVANVTAAASHTAGEASMFPCAETPAAAHLAAVGDARGAGMRGRPAVAEEGDLAEVPLPVGLEQLGQRIRRRMTGSKPVEASWAVAALREGLRRDDAYARTSPCAERHAEGARLHGDAELAARLVPSEDRVRHPTEPS
jgi:hypothetical protein